MLDILVSFVTAYEKKVRLFANQREGTVSLIVSFMNQESMHLNNNPEASFRV